MALERVLVVGAGQMGSGIAQVAAQAGLQVYLHDLSLSLVERGLASIAGNLTRDVDKGRRTVADRAAILARITPTADRASVSGVDLVIEAIVENLSVKCELFQSLDTMAHPDCIFASNTSSLPITRLAAATQRAGRFIGMHFMNPVPVMKLVEIIRGAATLDETHVAIRGLTERMGKVPVLVNDFPGFVSNRVLMPLINEAAFVLYEGVAGTEAIDAVMKLGMNHPLGPLQLADFIGLDTCLYILGILYEGFKDPKYRPCPLLAQYVQAGYLGKKSGRGFYIYSVDGGMTPAPRAQV